jgi:predicted Rossmann-fold nucleotide-binding protein
LLKTSATILGTNNNNREDKKSEDGWGGGCINTYINSLKRMVTNKQNPFIIVVGSFGSMCEIFLLVALNFFISLRNAPILFFRGLIIHLGFQGDQL